MDLARRLGYFPKIRTRRERERERERRGGGITGNVSAANATERNFSLKAPS